MDLNMMLRDQAKMGLQTQLDAAVTNGDTEAARKIAGDLAKLEASLAPAPAPYGQAEIRAALDAKAAWFGVDPEKSGAALELGKNLNPKKFATAELFADALIKAVENKFKPPAAVVKPPENETDEDREAREAEEREAAEAATAKKRKTDGPREGDTGAGATRTAATRGPWTKMSDAPREVQADVTRAADKFVPKSGDPDAVKKAREKFVKSALEAHYAEHQRKAGKK